MYKQEVKLEDNESILILNKETGELKESKKRPNNIPEGKIVFEPDGIFKKDYTKSWKYLKDEFTAIEFKAAFSLALMAKANTNSLEPLNDETAYKELAVLLDVGKNKVNAVLKKLWKYGVYAKFEVAKQDTEYKKYWILNPYLSFGGKLINSDIAQLFIGTLIEIAYNKEIE